MYVPVDFNNNNNNNNKISSDALVLHYCIVNHTLYVFMCMRGFQPTMWGFYYACYS